MKEYFLQILGIFYVVLALILFGTNVGRNKRGNTKISSKKKETMQIMEGKGVKCEVVGDKDNAVYREEEV
jgi:hypothetical protein